jgi:hypothetical protein
MNHISPNRISQEWVDKGYWTREYADPAVTVGYKDQEFIAVHPSVATLEYCNDQCRRHERQLMAAEYQAV